MAYHTILYIISYHTIPYHTIPYHTIPYHTIPYHTMPCHAMPCHAMPCHAMPCHAMPYHTILYHTIPYYTIPYYTIRNVTSSMSSPSFETNQLIAYDGWLDNATNLGVSGIISILQELWPSWRLDHQGYLPQDLEDRGVGKTEITD